jgi:hypothetical protein
LVFIDESIAAGRFGDLEPGWIGVGRGFGEPWCSLTERAVGPVFVVVFVVVVDVVDDQLFELVLVPDDGAVEKLSADRSDPAFSEGVGHRSADRCLEDLESFGSEDLVEAFDELATPISNEG